MAADLPIFAQWIRDGEDGVRVILPVLRRPHRVAPVLASLLASEQREPVRPLFVLSFGDTKEMDAVRLTGADFVMLDMERQPGDYARKINIGAAVTRNSWVFTGADDVHFHPGWADSAIDYADEQDLRAVGVNDLGRWVSRRDGPPATHFLMARSYVEQGTIDQPGVIFHTGYDHNYVDNEFVDTAQMRGEYGYCVDAKVEHLHPVWRKGQRDEVYQLGRRAIRADHRLYQARRALWT